jgi:hypothetical protein
MGAPVRILETTVRDGDYEIDHSGSADDVALLASLLVAGRLPL